MRIMPTDNQVASAMASRGASLPLCPTGAVRACHRKREKSRPMRTKTGVAYRVRDEDLIANTIGDAGPERPIGCQGVIVAGGQIRAPGVVRRCLVFREAKGSIETKA